MLESKIVGKIIRRYIKRDSTDTFIYRSAADRFFVSGAE